MMGRQTGDQSQLFYLFNLEERIPASYLLRRVNPVVTQVLIGLREKLEPFYSEIGRPSIDPELMIRIHDCLLSGEAAQSIRRLDPRGCDFGLTITLRPKFINEVTRLREIGRKVENMLFGSRDERLWNAHRPGRDKCRSRLGADCSHGHATRLSPPGAAK